MRSERFAASPSGVETVRVQFLYGETGLMVAHEVHTHWGAHIPVVLITGDTRRETIQALKKSGFYVLYKPVHADELRALLRMLLHDQTAFRISQ